MSRIGYSVTQGEEKAKPLGKKKRQRLKPLDADHQGLKACLDTKPRLQKVNKVQ
jgi:hypothetical protein